jgi:gliding motility-associated-like protein
MRNVRHIMHQDRRKISTFIKSVIILCSAFIFLNVSPARAQVITNQGAAITIVPGTVVGSGDAFNNPGGLISNDGEINLKGNYTSTATTNGNGFYRLGGNWTNTGGLFIPGTSTVVFNGSDNQLITRIGGESFFNMSVLNTGAPSLKSVRLADNATVLGTLWFSAGNVDAGTYVLYLSNPAAAALNYTSTTASRVIGKFRRGVNQTATYLFPLGNISHYNPANIRTNNISSAGSLLSEFLSANPGNAGLPVPDPPVEIGDAYPGGYWSFTSNSFSSSDFHINLDASGFLDGGGIPDTIRDITRVIKRPAGGNWTVDGTHVDAAGTVVYRNNLTGDISALGTEFALGRARPLITVHPLSQILCEAPTDAVFSVTATGAGPLTYRWYKDGVIITNGPHYSGARTNTLTIIGLVLTDAGTYYCIVSDKYRNKTQSNPATLVVNKRPVASATPQNQLHECSNIAFENIVLGETYGVPGTTYVWSRDNPANITTAIPVTGTAANIGDALTGSFINTSDDPITITFTITPIGPAPTLCVGLQPVVATLVINPTPRLVPDNSLKQICYGATTLITLTTPTHMTQGVIQFDYSVTTSSAAIVGNTTNDINLPVNYQIKRSYTNTSDTMQSVFYHITPKNVISGCNSGTIIVPQVKVHPEPLQNMFVSVPFTCAGGSAGVLTSVLSKATKPDKIHWTRPWRPDTIYYSNSNTDNLAIHYAGIYKVTVQDSMGCSKSSNNLFVSGAVFNSQLQVKETDTGFGTSCRGTADGEISIWEESSSTAVPPFEFWLVRNGLDTLGHGILTATGYANRAVVLSLPSGHYQLFIKDSNGCYNGDYPSADIMDPYPIEVAIDKSKYGNNNVSCLNYSDGSAWVKTIAGGNGSYSYLWTTLDGMITGPNNLNRIDNIPAGTYYLTTTDLHNCSVQDTVVLTEPAGMTVSAFKLSSSPYGPLNIACSGDKTGSIELTIAGGSGNYIYSWSGPGPFTANTKDIFNLGAGTYSATITDQANATCIMLPLPTYTLTEPAPLNISAAGTFNISCHGGTGSVDITVTGGSAGTYVYTWSTTNGSGIVPGQEDQPALTAGTYHLIVKDANNCSIATDVTLTQPAALAATLTPKHVTCNPPGFNNGAVDLTVSGGVAPYSYSWSNGPSTEDISGLTAGTYSVTIKDANNCILPGSVVVNPPAPLLYTKVLSDYGGFNVSCKGSANGSVNITTTSGQAPFIFDWQKAGGGFSAATEDITGLKAGQYNLKITDSNLCETTETIDINEPGKLSMSFALSSSIAGGYNINCAGASTGSIDVAPVNAVTSTTYLWSDGNTSKTRINIPAGDYGVVITDANGCRADSSVTLTDPDLLKLVFAVTQPWCADKPDGEIKLTITGGVVGTDYTYRWSSDNSTGSSISNILSGEFKVTVTDLNGCSIRDSVIVKPQRETCLIIPNAISPNGDLINDFWNIGLIELYPQIEIKVFNRWGQIVWRSEKGYPQPWDGRSNGSLLPVDSYHYIIDLHNGSKPLLGDITVIR